MAITIKVFFVEREENEPSEIRRFQWQQSYSLEQLKAKVSNVFSVKLEPELISLSGRGRDGKSVKIESDSDLIWTYGQANYQSNVKLWVTMRETGECLARDSPRVEGDSGNKKIESDEKCVTLEDIQFEERDLETETYSDCVTTPELYQAGCMFPKIETETLQTSSNTCEPEPQLGTESTIRRSSQPSELDSPHLDTRFCTSYGKNASFGNTFRQIMKDFSCCQTLSAPNPPELPPQFVESLCTLREMGFEVENPNVLKILRQNDGHLEKTIEDVLNSSF